MNPSLKTITFAVAAAACLGAGTVSAAPPANIANTVWTMQINRTVDVLTITSQLQQLNGKSGVLTQAVTLDPEGQAVADALITFVCIDLKTQKALPLEGELREKLELMIA